MQRVLGVGELLRGLEELRPRDADYWTVEVGEPGAAWAVVRELSLDRLILAGVAAGPGLLALVRAALGHDPGAQEFLTYLRVGFLRWGTCRRCRGGCSGWCGGWRSVGRGAGRARAVSGHRHETCPARACPAGVVPGRRGAGAARGAYDGPCHAHEAVACALVHPEVGAEALGWGEGAGGVAVAAEGGAGRGVGAAVRLPGGAARLRLPARAAGRAGRTVGGGAAGRELGPDPVRCWTRWSVTRRGGWPCTAAHSANASGHQDTVSSGQADLTYGYPIAPPILPGGWPPPVPEICGNSETFTIGLGATRSCAGARCPTAWPPRTWQGGGRRRRRTGRTAAGRAARRPWWRADEGVVDLDHRALLRHQPEDLGGHEVADQAERVGVVHLLDPQPGRGHRGAAGSSWCSGGRGRWRCRRGPSRTGTPAR